jgi:hypothetical protein
MSSFAFSTTWASVSPRVIVTRSRTASFIDAMARSQMYSIGTRMRSAAAVSAPSTVIVSVTLLRWYSAQVVRTCTTIVLIVSVAGIALGSLVSRAMPTKLFTLMYNSASIMPPHGARTCPLSAVMSTSS